MLEALSHPSHTAIYLDTSSLVWMYRLSSGARREFMDWASAGGLSGKVHIPIWSLHELHKHRGAPDVLFPARPKITSIEKELESLTESASLFVDDDLAVRKAFGGRSQYLDFLDDAKKKLIRALKVMKEVDTAKVEEDILPFFERIALRGAFPDIPTAQREFGSRSEGRVPPGYQDSRKKGDDGEVGGSGANRFGDLVFWQEILRDTLSKEQIQKVIIITHDGKPDWVFSPQRYKDYDGKVRNNSAKPKVVTCPHPTLSAEIALTSGIEELYILTIPQLVQLISSRGDAKSVQQLARAVQIEQEAEDARVKEVEHPEQKNDRSHDENGEEEEAAPAVEEPEFKVQEDEKPEFVAEAQPTEEILTEADEQEEDADLRVILDSLSEEALKDATYVAEGGEGTPDPIIRALRTYSWYTQNPAIGKVSAVLAERQPSCDGIFVLGRNVYQAACGNSNSAMKLLDGLDRYLSGKPFPQAEIFYAGVAFEAYFDSNGLIRAHPKDEFISPIFIVAQSHRFAVVAEWLRQKIGTDSQKFLKLPGASIEADIFTLEEAEGKIVGLKLRGIDLVEPDEDDYSYDSLPQECSERDMKEQIAAHFSTLISCIEFVPEWEGVKDLSHLKFISWGPHTEIKFQE
nr:PIN-like domain-containing protein [Puniceibacterium sediminis]